MTHNATETRQHTPEVFSFLGCYLCVVILIFVVGGPVVL